MELFTGTSAAAVQASQLSGLLSYSNSIRTQPLAAPTTSPRTTMDSLKAESNADSVVAISDIRENGGGLSESPGLGVSGANPRLVNGEAVSSVGVINGEKTTADVQRLSAAQSVLKKVLSVSEAEGGLLSSASQSSSSTQGAEQAEIERGGVVNGSGGVITDATPDSQSKVC